MNIKKTNQNLDIYFEAEGQIIKEKNKFIYIILVNNKKTPIIASLNKNTKKQFYSINKFDKVKLKISMLDTKNIKITKIIKLK